MTIEELNKAYEMALSSIDDILADMQCKIKDSEKQEEKKSSRKCSLKRGEQYYYMDSRGVILYDNFIPSNEVDCGRYLIGNCFKTEEEAKFTVEQLKVLAELREYADNAPIWDCKSYHWIIWYDYKADKLCTDEWWRQSKLVSFNLYFSSEEQAQKAIDAIGEDRLKKYYFCVED